MSRLLFALLCLIPQDVSLDRLVDRLGDADPKVREEAAVLLAERMEEARPALLRAATHPDPEVRGRAATLVARHDRRVTLELLRRDQRPIKLSNPGGEGSFEGGRFLFERNHWAPEGEPRGTIFETRLEPTIDGEIEWSVAVTSQDQALPIETCSLHSPGKVYVPGPPPGDCVLMLRGIRRWLCDVGPVDFKDPGVGSSVRVGPYTVMLEWPELVVLSDVPMPESILAKTIQASEVQVRLRSGRYVRRGGWRGPMMNFPPARDEGEEPAWCGCPELPSKKPAPPKLEELRIALRGYQNTPIDDVESISLVFHQPIEEPFELRSPVLR